VVAEPIDRPAQSSARAHLRYATKFPYLTERHLLAGGITAEVIKLYGSIELGPLTGLADRIVDLVASGETLRANRLRELETILAVSSRLVVNRAAFKLKQAEIRAWIDRLERALATRAPRHAAGGRA
jgi:ATP phosphoribosyltransferase